MYIIERLKQDYPQFKKELEQYDQYLLRTHGKEYNAHRIFDDQKENFKFVQAAYDSLAKTGSHGKEFNKQMALYEQSFNDDKDFLAYFVHQFYDIDGRNMTVPELKEIIQEKFKQIDKLRVGG